MNARQRVRARVTLSGRMSELRDPACAERSARLRVRITEVSVAEASPGRPNSVGLADYRSSEPDPLYLGAAEQLQHLAAHHAEAISALTRLCDREALIGVTQVLPIALDRYGIVLRMERMRDHRDIRLPFERRIDTGTEAATEMRKLLARAARRRPCGGARPA